MLRKPTSLLVAALAALALFAADRHALGKDGGRDRDADMAREAVLSGKILTLVDILTRLKDKLGGRVIEVELDREDGRYVYELKVISDTGQVIEYEVDATTADIIKFKTKAR